LANGNILTLIVVAAWWALRGNRLGILSFLTLTALVPRPIMIPVLIAILWHRRWARFAFGAIVIAVVGASVYAGQLDDFVARLVVATQEMSSIWNIAPTRIMGTLWIPIGAALALLLYRRGWVGTAGVALAPILFPYYLLFVLIDIPVLIAVLDRHGVTDRLRKLIGRSPSLGLPVGQSLDGAASQ
jgi:hypothetical protein